MLYSIPSLALFALLIPITGIKSVLTAEIALVSYTILILMRNILAGLDGVPAEIIEAAEGMGYTPCQRLWRVELPIALPVIVAGRPNRDGDDDRPRDGHRPDRDPVAGQPHRTTSACRASSSPRWPSGSLGCVALAVVADLGLLALQRLLTPWARDRAGT